jgi:soluble lytic murein transglycosylase
MRQAFVASTTLRPMAQQLLQDRTPEAYEGVQAFARKHASEDAGALAWLVLGYARTLDRDFAKAIDALMRAQPNAGDLADYVTYYLGNAYLQSGISRDAVTTLGDFKKKYPDSVLGRDAAVVYASALLGEGRGAETIAILEKEREPSRSDLELTLGRAYAAAEQTNKAAAALKSVYYKMPTSADADAAGTELRKLGVVAVSPEERRTRADLLMKGRRYADAASDYRELAGEVAPADRPAIELALASALQKSGRGKDAKDILVKATDATGDAAAQRLYMLGDLARSSDDEGAFQQTLDQLRQTAPASGWFEQALLSSANRYLLKKDYDRAIDVYRELQQRFPNGAKASYAHWKTAWLALRQGRVDEAKKGFEQQIVQYPSSAELPAALYWRARLAEEDGETAKARAFYLKLSDRFRNYYYADLARTRLKGLKNSETVHYSLLDRVPPLPRGPKVIEPEIPEDNLRVQKAELLENGALADLAVREVQAAAQEEEGDWAPVEMARIYKNTGRYDRALSLMKRTVPNYFALDVPEIPRSYWEALFPEAYWSDLKRYSTENDLDPFLVASLIRQESEFNPMAVSRANAVGLMQLLPSTGKKVAKDLKVKHFNPSELYLPVRNLQLGTRYFKSMVDQFGGQFEYALAAYNAGSDRVNEWLGQAKYRDVPEFVESIPFTETREYVQAIMRNANVYKQLYGTP